MGRVMTGAAAYVDRRRGDFHLSIHRILLPRDLVSRQVRNNHPSLKFSKNAKIVFATVIFLRNRRNIPTENTLMSAFEIKKCPKAIIGFDISFVS
jgi:hypothetical protein